MAVGTLRHAGTVEHAVVQRLRDWMPYYTERVMEQQDDPLELPELRGVIRVSELSKWPEDQLPLAVVISPGTASVPTKDGDGYYSAVYALDVAVIVSAREEDGSRDLAQFYGAAIRGCLLQRRSLGNAIETSRWLGEGFDDLPVDERRTLFCGVNRFEAELGEVVSWQLAPPGDPDITGEVQDINVEVESVESID